MSETRENKSALSHADQMASDTTNFAGKGNDGSVATGSTMARLAFGLHGSHLLVPNRFQSLRVDIASAAMSMKPEPGHCGSSEQ